MSNRQDFPNKTTNSKQSRTNVIVHAPLSSPTSTATSQQDLTVVSVADNSPNSSLASSPSTGTINTSNIPAVIETIGGDKPLINSFLSSPVPLPSSAPPDLGDSTHVRVSPPSSSRPDPGVIAPVRGPNSGYASACPPPCPSASIPVRESTNLVKASATENENEFKWSQFLVSLPRGTNKDIKLESFIKYWQSGKVLIYNQDFHCLDYITVPDLVSRLGLPTNLNIVTAKDLNKNNTKLLKQSK